MQLIKEADLTQGWKAQLFDTGEMLVRKAETGQTTWLPKQSVDTLIEIFDQLNKEALAEKETN